MIAEMCGGHDSLSCWATITFIRSFALFVLDMLKFMKICYYGFLANVCKKKAVLLIRRLIGKYIEVKQAVRETVWEKMLRLTGRDIMRCPHWR